jgi:hypothetical protein
MSRAVPCKGTDGHKEANSAFPILIVLSLKLREKFRSALCDKGGIHQNAMSQDTLYILS